MLKNASVAAITKLTSTPANIPNKMYVVRLRFFAKRPPCLTPFSQRRRYALAANDQFAPSVSASPVHNKVRKLLRKEPELPVLHRHQHARPVVHSVVIGWRHVEHALTADDFVLLLECVAKRGSKGLGSRFCDLKRNRNCAFEQDAGIPGVRTKRRRHAAELFLVGRDVILRNLLRRIGIGNLVDHQHGASCEYRSFDLVAAELD